jgi:hypothetical protein
MSEYERNEVKSHKHDGESHEHRGGNHPHVHDGKGKDKVVSAPKASSKK